MEEKSIFTSGKNSVPHIQKNPLTKHIYTSNSFRYNQIDEEFGMSKDI